MDYWADYWRDVVGFNVIPMNGKIPVEEYKQFFDRAIPIELHNYWRNNALFDNGIAIINGRLWNNEHRKHLFGHIVDTDTEAGTELIMNMKGVQLTLDDMIKRGIAIEKTPRGFHFIIFSEMEFPHLAANTSGVEVKGSNKLTTVAPTVTEGVRRELIGDSMKALEECVTFSDFMYHVNDKVKQYGIEYLNGNGKTSYNPVLRNKQKIPKGQRHNRLLSYANSLIARLYNTTNRETIYKYFETYNNAECEEPLPESELEQIFKDAWNNIEKKTITTTNDSSQEVISVLQAKRLQTGQITVIGTIVSVSDMFVLDLTDPETKVPLYKNAKSIQLEDTKTLDDNERLDAMLYDDMINNVVAGETVKITGNMRIEDKKANGKSKKKFNVLHATSIEYTNRKEILVTDRDIEAFQRFVSLPQLIDRLVSMIAPNIIGHDELINIYCNEIVYQCS